MELQSLELGWLGLGLALLLLALVMAIKARQWWREVGLPGGDIIYTDTGTWYRQHDPLYSVPLQLTGRPDYLVEQPNGVVIPVEVKSGTAPADPYEGHIMQLAAYCVLVEEAYGRRPDHGIIQYVDKAFAVGFTEGLEEDLLDVLAEMREDLYAEDVDRNHYNWRRCAGCGHRNHCYQRLA
jgi:CRISPR-associated exonuclease Cas4